MDVAYRFAENIIETEYDVIPKRAIELARRDVLDTLGIILAGSNSPASKAIMGLVSDWGGKHESTVIMFGKKVPSPYAALINSTSAYSLNYDDESPGVGHAGCTVIPTALAIAQRKGKVNGKDFLTAVTLGIDISCRLGVASENMVLGPGWLYPPLLGTFGATACAGKLLNLNKEQMVDAFGIAYSQAAGNRQVNRDGAVIGHVQPGFAAKAAVLATLMASMGITGSKNTFEGQHGLFPLYIRSNYDPKKLTYNLGKRFAVIDTGFKLYPACSATCAAIDATLSLIGEYDIVPDDVNEVLVHVSECSRGVSEPIEVKRRPRTIVDAQFSIPWTVATALVRKKVTIDDFTPDAINNLKVINIAQKIKPVIDLEDLGQDRFPANVEIKMNNGSVYSRRVDSPKGHPSNPLSWEELQTKFKDCATHGRKKLSRNKVESVIKSIVNLENIVDVGKVVELLS